MNYPEEMVNSFEVPIPRQILKRPKIIKFMFCMYELDPTPRSLTKF